LVVLWLASLGWDLRTYRKKTELTLRQLLTVLALGLGAELATFMGAVGACALLGFILGRSVS
jgi:hypothetical protein